MGFWGRYRPKTPKPQTHKPFLWIYAWRTFNRQSSEFIGNLFCIILSSMPDIQGFASNLSGILSGIFPSTPADIQGFVGNLSSIFPFTPPDLRSSSEIFPSFFHQPLSTSEVRRKYFQQLSIYLYRYSKFAGYLFSTFPFTLADFKSSPDIFPALFHLP